MGFLIRWMFALILIVATWNPSFWNYSEWVGTNFASQLPLAVLGALVLIAGYLIYLRATLNSIGIVGMVLILALVGAILWVMFSQGWMTFGNSAFNGWIIILALSLVLAVGMYFSVIWRRMSGQVDVDEVDTP